MKLKKKLKILQKEIRNEIRKDVKRIFFIFLIHFHFSGSHQNKKSITTSDRFGLK